MSVYYDSWNAMLIALKNSLTTVGYLPREVVYEIQNCLIHLLIALKSLSSEKRKELKRSISHGRRANLDALKIGLFDLHTMLVRNRINTDCENSTNFQKKFSKARLVELQTLGAGHNETVNEFQNIIQEYSSGRSDSSLSIHMPPTALAQTNNNYCIFDNNMRDILWQWAQLEILLTSLCGQRVYAVSYNMIKAYLAWEDFLNELKSSVCTLKAAIIITIITNDCNNNFSNFLRNMPDGESFLRTRNNIKTQQHLTKKEINEQYKIMTQQATSLFPHILDYLGLTFQESLSVKS